MRRFPAITLLAVVIATMLHAENQIGVSAEAGPAFPIRGIRNLFGTGYGGTGSIDVFLNGNISIVASGGFFRWEYSSARVNAALASGGGPTGFEVSGPFQAIPVTIGACFTFDGAFLRPFFGLAGGACFLRRRIAGVTAMPAAPLPSGQFTATWTEPAMSVDAGLSFVLLGGLRLDIGGMYTAFSNADDRIEPSEFFGRKITGLNTASFAGLEAGLTVVF